MKIYIREQQKTDIQVRVHYLETLKTETIWYLNEADIFIQKVYLTWARRISGAVLFISVIAHTYASSVLGWGIPALAPPTTDGITTGLRAAGPR